MLELLPRGFARFNRTIDQLRALGHFNFRRIALERIPSRGRDRARHYKETRPGNVSFLDCLFDADVSVARSLRFYIAQGREALL